jgi:Zn-dependent protease
MLMNITFDDLTKNARQAIELAYQHAGRQRAPRVEPEHLLLGVLAAPSELTRRVLAAMQIDLRRISQALEARLSPGAASPMDAPIMAAETLHVIQYANKEARLLGHPQSDTIHMLLGLLYENGRPAADALEEAGLSLFDLRQSAMRLSKRVELPREGGMRGVLSLSPVFLVPLGLMIGSGLGLYMAPAKLYVTPLTIVFIVGGWITSVCVHEFGHALAAYLGGDLSVKDKGYLTLNPLRYTHTLFSIVLPLLYLMIGGIGLPGGAVYINISALRSRRWETIVAAAGPLATAAFGLLVIWPFFFHWERWITAQNWYFWPALAYLGFLQVCALLFNLLPLPPLDGFGIIAPRLSPALRLQALMFGNLGLILVFVMLSQPGPISDMFWTEVFAVARALHIPASLIDMGIDQFRF